MNSQMKPEASEAESRSGPWPFITRRSFILHGQRVTLKSRQHRKGLVHLSRHDYVPLWRQPAYNWWTGLVFSCGAVLFMLGAVLSLVPNPLANWQIGIVFFMGSIPFTTAAYLQLFQAANLPADATPSQQAPPQKLRLIGWQPASLGWCSAITQFIGTLAFNVNTFDAIHPLPLWYDQDLTIWLPGIIGSVLFLISGYLAFMETSHGYWSFHPGALDWGITFSNLIGCVFFLTAGILAFVPRGPAPGWIADLANVHLFLGGTGFLVGALLMMRESHRIETLGSGERIAADLGAPKAEMGAKR